MLFAFYNNDDQIDSGHYCSVDYFGSRAGIRVSNATVLSNFTLTSLDDVEDLMPGSDALDFDVSLMDLTS